MNAPESASFWHQKYQHSKSWCIFLSRYMYSKTLLALSILIPLRDTMCKNQAVSKAMVSNDLPKMSIFGVWTPWIWLKIRNIRNSYKLCHWCGKILWLHNKSLKFRNILSSQRLPEAQKNIFWPKIILGTDIWKVLKQFMKKN